MKNLFRFLLVLLCVYLPFNAGAVVRSGTKTSAIDLGTSVEVVSENKSSCVEKYTVCMDSGCIIDNESGGRCQCSNKIKDLNAELEILKQKDSHTISFATVGKEIVEMGQYEDELMPDNVDDGVGYTSFKMSGSVGDKLRAEMHELCIEKMPECASQLILMTNMYTQKIKSDCVAYENSLVTKNQEVKERRAEAKKAVRGAALEQYQAANKYDLGQCLNEFTSCMRTEETCGEDWTGCIDNLGYDKMRGSIMDSIAIEGENSSVSIARSTMSVLESKKIICEGVTNQCVAVKDKVWAAFLKSAITDIKFAEMQAESNARTSCLTNISNCFVNACRDNIDDKNPDSYDFCLTHPETVKNFCKVEIEPCLTATGGSLDKPDDSTLWSSVLAKLSAMRVDSCTTELKECLQSEDRCGSDYSQCIGLDTNIIMRMCPYDKLVGCQKVYGKEKILKDEEGIYEEVARIVDGIVLNIDNEMLKTCQNAIDKAMTKVCGGDSANSCAEYAVNDTAIGAQSLKYQVCQYSTDSVENPSDFKWFDCRSKESDISDYELGRDRYARAEMAGPILPFAGVISGTINWATIEITNEGFIDVDKYLSRYKGEKNIPEEDKERVRSELLKIQDDINRVILSIEKDQWVSFCISGRQVKGVTDRFSKNRVRFPKLTNTIRQQIAMAALTRAKTNYFTKYDELSQRMQKDLVTVNERIANNIRANGEDAKARAAMEACKGIAEASAFAKAPVGQSLWAKIMVGVIVIILIIVACIFSFGAAAGPIGAGMAAGISSAGAASAAAAGAAATTVAFAMGAAPAVAAAIGTAVAVAVPVGVMAGTIYGVYRLVEHEKEAAAAARRSAAEAEKARQEAAFNSNAGAYVSFEWNYMEKITTNFDRETMTCKRCISPRKCKKTEWSLFTDRYCKKWSDWEEPTCTYMQF